MELKEKLKNLPCSPGVYLMKDSLNSVIYVGKSKNLKNRVSSYFQNSKAHSPKVIKLVKNLKDFEYITTDTEFEAFLLECKLIKEIKPIYNKQMKSPKSYIYIKISHHEKSPNIELSNEYDSDDGNTYFGPYTNKNTVEKALQGIKECCKILCTSNLRNISSCINYSLGLCIGMCVDDTSRKQYIGILNEIEELLNQKNDSILKKMENKMNASCEKFDFESAAKYRDYINAVKYLLNKVNVVKFTNENKNIVLLESLNNDSFKFFLIRGHEVLFKETYFINNISLEDLKIILLNKIFIYFNDIEIKNSINIGREEIDESQIIYTYLKSKSNNCKHIIIPNGSINSLDYNNKYINELLNDLFTQKSDN